MLALLHPNPPMDSEKQLSPSALEAAVKPSPPASVSPRARTAAPARRFEVGDRVRAKYQRGRLFFPGVVRVVQEVRIGDACGPIDFRYDIAYDDGDYDHALEAAYVKPPKRAVSEAGEPALTPAAAPSPREAPATTPLPPSLPPTVAAPAPREPPAPPAAPPPAPREPAAPPPAAAVLPAAAVPPAAVPAPREAVSYTHLTLPTIYSV